MLANEDQASTKEGAEGFENLRKYMGEALVASLMKKKETQQEEERASSTAAISALAPALKPAISAIAPAMRPVAKPTVDTPKNYRFSDGLAASVDDSALEQAAEVAASKLLKLMGGGKKSP